MKKNGLILVPVMPRPSKFKLPPLELGSESRGRRLARLRKEKGFTQVELAAKIGTTQTVISDYERDRLRPNAEMIIRIAQALDISTDEYLGLKPSQTNGPKLNRRFLRRLKMIETLPKRDQDALLRTIDAFLAKAS